MSLSINGTYVGCVRVANKCVCTFVYMYIYIFLINEHSKVLILHFCESKI